MLYFTSDPHFFHYNIMEYEKRPFSSVSHMNSAIVTNWNDTVSKDDEVFILGDVGFSKPDNINAILEQLNGKKYLIIGNHDKKIIKDIKHNFEWCKDYFLLKYEKQKLILFHFPVWEWDCKHHGSWHLHGHTHTTSHSDFEHPNKINVGMDIWNFKPISFDRIKQEIEKNNKPD